MFIFTVKYFRVGAALIGLVEFLLMINKAEYIKRFKLMIFMTQVPFAFISHGRNRSDRKLQSSDDDKYSVDTIMRLICLVKL